MIKLGNLSEAEVEEILLQSDPRYDTHAVKDVTRFIHLGALDVFKEIINDIIIEDRSELLISHAPQQLEKFVAKNLFRKLGIKFVCFEYSIKASNFFTHTHSNNQ
jgi:hypothetical protein